MLPNNEEEVKRDKKMKTYFIVEVENVAMTMSELKKWYTTHVLKKRVPFMTFKEKLSFYDWITEQVTSHKIMEAQAPSAKDAWLVY